MTTLIESRTNRLALEVRHETTPRGVQQLRAYRLGKLVAIRVTERRASSVRADAIEVVDARLSSEQRADVELALEEGLRILNDGRGLCECA